MILKAYSEYNTIPEAFSSPGHCSTENDYSGLLIKWESKGPKCIQYELNHIDIWAIFAIIFSYMNCFY